MALADTSRPAEPAVLPRRRRAHPVPVLDGALDVVVAALAVWTLLAWLMVVGLPLAVGWLWPVLVAGLIWLRSRGAWYPVPAVSALQGWAAVGLATATAALASMVSRPDGDDAYYVIRSTWVADRGALPDGDMIFSDGQWPATFGPDPNLTSLETLFGVVARVTGLATGDVVYRWFVPVAAFLAVWALHVLLRVWQARRPTASTVLALVFLVMGGYAGSTWGNVHLARIWQGKIVLVAVLVPLLHAVLTALLSKRGGTTRPGLLMLLALGLAGAGVSTTAVFILPLVTVAVGSAVLVLHRRWSDVVLAVVATAAGPAVMGIWTILSPAGAGNEPGRSTGWLWLRILGSSGWVATLVVLAAVLVVVGALRPRWASADPTALRILAGALVVGFLFTVPPLYPVLTALMGGDAIAHRLAWVLPVPAVIGLLASLPARRWGLPVVPAVAGALAVILGVGQPLWAASNMAHLGQLGTWKVRDQADLAAARWIVEQQPQGRYLAASWVAMMTGVLTSELRPVGTRMDYVASLDEIPGSQVDERVLLQGVADGVESRLPENREPALAALDALDVEVACVAWDDAFTQDLFGTAGYVPAYAVGPWTCWDRTPAHG